MAEAHRASLVPTNLYGKAQHKTLHARISEDIVKYHDGSRFFRTSPGQFFLREFLDDPSVTHEYKQLSPTRRRIRELIRGPALAVPPEHIQRTAESYEVIAKTEVLKLLKAHRHSYRDPKKAPESVFVRSFVCVCRDSNILSYRLGRYRDDRDTFMHKRSIGFSTLVHINEHTLFNVEDLGIVEAGIRATKIDLDIPAPPPTASDVEIADLRGFVLVTQPPGARALLAMVSYICPTWFEPIKRRLALNDLRWIDPVTGINNIDDFDPWSQAILQTKGTVKSLFGSRVV
jgi:hypothetical protein